MDEPVPEVLTDLDVVSSFGEMLIKPGVHTHTHTCDVYGVVDSDTDTSE